MVPVFVMFSIGLIVGKKVQVSALRFCQFIIITYFARTQKQYD